MPVEKIFKEMIHFQCMAYNYMANPEGHGIYNFARTLLGHHF